MPNQKRFKVVEVKRDTIKVEDQFGIRQKDGKLPTIDYFGMDIGVDFSIGDWVEIVIRKQE